MLRRGAEGASPEGTGTKLSGKRTVTESNPGKIWPFKSRSGLDTEGDKSRAFWE